MISLSLKWHYMNLELQLQLSGNVAILSSPVECPSVCFTILDSILEESCSQQYVILSQQYISLPIWVPTSDGVV